MFKALVEPTPVIRAIRISIKGLDEAIDHALGLLGVKNFREDERFRLMSVPRNVTKAFPPAFISSGNGDPLAPQAIVLAQKLAQLGVRVDTLFFPRDRVPALPHKYQFNLDDPAGRESAESHAGVPGSDPRAGHRSITTLTTRA